MDVLMPQLGETVAEGKISKWFVSAGDTVKPGDNLFEIETDKVSMEVPAISSGVLAAIHVQAGEVAPVGAVVAIIQGKGEAVSTSKLAAPLTPAKAVIDKREAPDSRVRGNQQQEAANLPFRMEPFREVRSPERNYGPARLPGGTVVTPLARRLAGEAGIDLSRIKGSGPHGRIVASDVAQAQSNAPALGQAQTSASIVLTADVELGQALAVCGAAPAIELTDIVIKAWGSALRRIAPSDNADIAIVVGKAQPVIHDVQSKSLTAIATIRRDLAARADDGALTAGDGRRATTLISSPSVPGITSVAGVLLPPHVTMLGVGAARRAPVEAADGSVRFVSVMTVTLSCDHRWVDSTLGAELLGAFKGFVEQPVTMIV